MLQARYYQNQLNKGKKDRLIDIVFTSEEKNIDFSIDLFLIVDTSTSMEESIDKVVETILVVYKYIQNIQRKINLYIITFNTTAKLIYPNNSVLFEESIKTIESDGMTNMGDALSLAESIKTNNYRAMIMLSDGMPNHGKVVTKNELRLLAESVAHDKISIGFGREYDPNLLSSLGDFILANNISDIREIIPFTIGRILSTYASHGQFILEFPYTRVVIGNTKVDLIYNEQVYHLGLAIDPNLVRINTEIKFEYTLYSGEKVSISTYLLKAENIPQEILGMYHLASCSRLIISYEQNKIDKKYIQERLNSWPDSPYSEECKIKLNQLLLGKIDYYDEAEQSREIKDQRGYRHNSNYITPTQVNVLDEIASYY